MLKFVDYHGTVDADAAIEAANAVMDKYGLTEADLCAENPSAEAREVEASAIAAACGAEDLRFIDPTNVGHLEVQDPIDG